MALSNKSKAFLVYVALSALESIRDDEQRNTEVFEKMDTGIDQLVGIIEMYLAKPFTASEISKAAAVVDMMNERIAEFR